MLIGVRHDGASGEVLVLGQIQSLGDADDVARESATGVGTEDCGRQEVRFNGGFDVVLEGILSTVCPLQHTHERSTEDGAPLTVLGDLQEAVAILQRNAVVGVLGTVVQFLPLVVAIQSLEDAVEDCLEQDGRHRGASQSLACLLPDGRSIRGVDHAADGLVDTLNRGVPVGHPRVDDLTVATLTREVHSHLGGVLDTLKTSFVGVAELIDGGQILRKAGLRFGDLVERTHLTDSPSSRVLSTGHRLGEALVVVVIGGMSSAQRLEGLPVITVLGDLLSGLSVVLGEVQTGDGVDNRGRQVAGQVTDREGRVDTGDRGLHGRGQRVAGFQEVLLQIVGQMTRHHTNGLVQILADVGGVLASVQPTGQLVIAADFLQTGLLGFLNRVSQVRDIGAAGDQSVGVSTVLPVPVEVRHVGERTILVQHSGVDDVHVQLVQAVQTNDLADDVGEAVLDVHDLGVTALCLLHGFADSRTAGTHETSSTDAVLVGAVGRDVVGIHLVHTVVLGLGDRVTDCPVTHEQIPPLVDTVCLIEQPRLFGEVLIHDALTGFSRDAVALVVSEDGFVLCFVVGANQADVFECPLLSFVLAQLLDFLLGHRDQTSELFLIHVAQPFVIQFEGLQSGLGTSHDAHAVDVMPVEHEVLQQSLLAFVDLLMSLVPAQEHVAHGLADSVTGAVNQTLLEDSLHGGSGTSENVDQSTCAHIGDLSLGEAVDRLGHVHEVAVGGSAQSAQLLSCVLELLDAGALLRVLADRVNQTLLSLDLSALLRSQTGVTQSRLSGVALQLGVLLQLGDLLGVGVLLSTETLSGVAALGHTVGVVLHLSLGALDLLCLGDGGTDGLGLSLTGVGQLGVRDALLFAHLLGVVDHPCGQIHLRVDGVLQLCGLLVVLGFGGTAFRSLESALQLCAGQISAVSLLVPLLELRSDGVLYCGVGMGLLAVALHDLVSVRLVQRDDVGEVGLDLSVKLRGNRHIRDRLRAVLDHVAVFVV